jgi:hypothetical protein
MNGIFSRTAASAAVAILLAAAPIGAGTACCACAAPRWNRARRRPPQSDKRPLTSSSLAMPAIGRLGSGSGILRHCDTQPEVTPLTSLRNLRPNWNAYPRQADPRMTLQKLTRVKRGSLSASTSALTLPKVVSGLCLMPS